MSGGVDSSVAAALLKKQGYLVEGAYMKNFSPESWKGVLQADCPWEKDVKDAKAVCKKLGIPFRSFNFEKEYKKSVIDYFFREYKTGRTPNPDIMCNKEIKFGLFLEKALKLGFDFVATGHYAKIQTTSLPSSPHHLGRGVSLSRRWRGTKGEVEYQLLKGADPKKDQSYFLYALNQTQLSHTLFPIGGYTKVEVRKLAKKFGLQNWDKKDSQGICFVGHVNLREFLKQRLPEREGEIVDTTGNVLGHHRGAWYYTIGQRHGLGIGGGSPYYVAEKNVKHNQIIVAEGRYNRLVYYTRAKVKKLHWINETPSYPLSCKAKIRYQQTDQICTISSKPSLRVLAKQSQRDRHVPTRVGTRDDRELIVSFYKPQFAVAPGQAIVFYKGSQVLGGAIIA